jgi:hypothetical protein
MQFSRWMLTVIVRSVKLSKSKKLDIGKFI